MAALLASTFAPILFVLAGMSVVMSAAWLTQRAQGNAGWIDVFWTFGTGASCTVVALWPTPDAVPARQALVAGLAATWSVRLGVYMARRVGASPEDTRYARLRGEWGAAFQRRLFSLVIVQAPATAMLTISILVAAHAPWPLGLRDVAGVLILLVAIVGEGAADEQMRRFKQTSGPGQIMQRGLWSWSRHPNYFFEWFGWLAYPAIGFSPDAPLSAASFIAPALMYLILRYGTGVPALERTMLASRGDAFSAYQARVAVFFPAPPKRDHA